jgi:hypothetical protein
MKIENKANYQLTNRVQTENPRGPDTTASFVTVLAGKTKGDSGNSCSVSAAKTETYDFSNITPKALRETVNGLIRSGQLNLDETSSLLGMMAPTQIGTDGSFTTTSDSPVDVFAKIQAGIEGALSRNDIQIEEYLQRAADALLRYQGQTAKIYIQA